MIPGVSDVQRLPRLAKIRLGEKAQGDRGPYPKAIDHFSFVDCPEVAAIYGNRCTELSPVLFHSDDEESIFPTARKAYRKSGLFCKCSNGVTATRVFDPKDSFAVETLKAAGEECEPGDMFEFPCPGPECPLMEGGYCKNIGRLLFILPNVPKLGVYEITTTSFYSITNVLNVMRNVRSLIGTVVGVPFVLRLKGQDVQPDGKKKTVYVLDLECRASLSNLVAMGRRIKASGGSALALIDAPDEVPDDLMPFGGAALDAELAGGPRALPPAKPARSLDDVKARMAAPAQAAPAQAAPAQAAPAQAAPAPQQTAPPPPASSPNPEPAIPPQAAGNPAAPAASAAGVHPPSPAAAPAASPSATSMPTFNF